MRRVVITGMGIYSCIGKNQDEVKDSLFQGRSGIGIDPARKEMGYFSALTGLVERPDLKKLLDRKKRHSLAEQGEYAYMATLEAFRQAQIDEEFLLDHEVGILYGNDSSAAPVIEAIDVIRAKKNTAMVGSGSIFQSMNSTITMNLSVIFHLKGINFTISGACASGSHAIGMAYLLIKSGLQDCILCGGAQEVNPYSVGSFDGLGAFSTREDEPEKASRPFDKGRDGLVPSGGGASLVLESYESAVRRGATILAEVIGYGFSSNGDHISVPNVDGPRRSLQMAINDAGIPLEEIQYINAHATSTPVGDLNEAKAIAEVFGNHRPYVTSTKSQTGHEMWMAGASEVIKGILDSMITAVQNVDWGLLGRKIAEFLANIDWVGITERLSELIGSVIGGIAAFLAGVFQDVGKDIIWGLLFGIGDKLADIAAWIKEHIFNPFIEGFKEAFGIHSPSEKMKPYGKYILEGVIEGLKNTFGEWRDALNEWYSNHIAPWFTAQKWSELYDAIKTNLKSKWDETVGQWAADISSWWSSHVAPWFTLSKWEGIAAKWYYQ